MARILVLSSQTAAGHVGLSAAQPTLQALGHTVTALPTVLLSNHPGFAHAAGRAVSPADLAAMIDALDANGWLAGHDALLTGYLPTAEHVALAADLAERLRRSAAPPRVVVDPVLGDEPKGLYVGRDAAEAIRDRLAPLADVLTPNRFELAWLTGLPVATASEAVAAARRLGARVLVTSPPVAGATGLLDVGAGEPILYPAARLPDVPHGAGDVLSALVAAGLDPGAALGRLAALCAASAGAPHLAIVPSEPWRVAPPVPGPPLAPEP
jgi:pyridoxine kinase